MTKQELISEIEKYAIIQNRRGLSKLIGTLVPNKRGLDVRVVNRLLIVTVDAKTLAGIVRFSVQDEESRPKIVDVEAFAEALANELSAEQDTEGTSILHRALDEAADAVFNSGDESIDAKEFE